MLNAIRETAEAIARSAGAILREYAVDAAHGGAAHSRLTIVYKDTDINPVTAADKASEAYIVSAIQGAYPDHHIHGEEGGGYGPSPEQAQFRWYVDPVDGTTNFAHGYPVYCVNLSVMDAAGEPVVGVTYDPTRDECFSGVKGGGATLNGRPIRVSRTETLLRALLSTGFPYDAHTADDNNTAAWSAFTRRTQSLRRSGSAALDFAYVACGRLDGYWELKLGPWDMMAGVVLVREAGGMVSTYDGGTGRLYTCRRVMCSNGLIHPAMVEVLMAVQTGISMG